VSKDAGWIYKSQDVIVDHCSFSWGTDEVLSVTGQFTDNITVQWSIISEALHCSCHEKGCHGFGSIMGGHISREPDDGYPSISYLHNLIAHNTRRNPKLAAEEDNDVVICNHLELQNSVIYNWASFGTHTDKGQCTYANVVSNYYKSGQDEHHRKSDKPINIHGYSAAHIFAQGNYWEGHPNSLNDNWGVMIAYPSSAKVDNPFSFAPVTSVDVNTSYSQVLASAGASLPQRDAVDSRVIESVKNGTGRIINSQSQVGGWPQLNSGTSPFDFDQDGMPDDWERSYGLNPNNSNDNLVDTDNDGYLNIEEYINGTAPAQFVPTSTPIPDYRSYLISWGTSTSGQDENLDGIVNGLDFSYLTN
jgi:hypothetical protein